MYLKKTHFSVLSSFLLTIFYHSAVVANDEVTDESIELAKHLSTTKAPVPIHRENPKYPMSAARKGSEGWTRMSLVIEADGSVSNVLVIDSVGDDAFISESIKAIKKWKYEPAYQDGEPVQRCDNAVQLDYKMWGDNRKGVSKKFKSWYEDTNQALQEKNLKLVAKQFEKYSSTKIRNIAENNFYEILLSDYARLTENKKSELYHLKRISLDKELLNDQQQLSILNNIFILEVNLQQYYQAKSTYEKLVALPTAESYLDTYQVMLDNVVTLVASNENIVFSGDIKEKQFWSHQLLRNKFSLVNVNGNLSKLDVRCANKFYSYTVAENNTWTIPNSWGECSVYVFGEDNATFTLVEHPLES